MYIKGQLLREDQREDINSISASVTVQGRIQGGGGGGLRELKPPPLQVNEMRHIHFGQNTNSKLQKNETPLHESAHEERQISIPEITYFSHQN